MLFSLFLSFSDATKFADIGRNIVSGLFFGCNFSFWQENIFISIQDKLFPFSTVLPVMPYSVVVFFKIFGINDTTVISTSFFYFILTLVFVYLLGKKIFNSRLVGAFSTLAVGASYDIVHYATNGASESPFMFEIVAGLYFASLKKKWANFVTVLFLILLYFTRPQAFIYIAGIILFWLLINFNLKKAFLYFLGVLVTGVLVDYLVLMPLNGKYFLYSVIGRGMGSSFNQSPVASDALRGAVIASGGFIQTFKNIFYNLYNFYKALPDIINPYFFTLFVVGLFLRSRDKLLRAFKISSVFMILVTFLVTAASIPFYRYLHPIIPLVYILAVGTLVEILNNLQITKRVSVVLVSFVLVVFFGVGQTVGVFLLDSRFEKKTHNVGEPPVYVELSYLLRDNTDPNYIIITNLDTWGSWYGERKTIWYPLDPDMLKPPDKEEPPFDAIYLTSYLMDDENYYMGEEWRQIFENPENIENEYIDKYYKLRGVYEVPAFQNYERMDARAVLLVRK